MLDLTRLRVLDAVSRCGSVTAAAVELGYSQPSVSHHLSRLEAETGAVLLQRVGRGVRLTEAGRLLASRSEEILGRVAAADAELASYVGLRAGHLRVASYASALSTFVPRAVEGLAAAHPGVRVSLVDAHSDHALELLRAGDVDLAVGFRSGDDPGQATAGVRHLPLGRDPIHLLVPPGAPVDVRAHRTSTWIAGCPRCRVELRDLTAGFGFEPDVGHSTDDMVVQQAWVAAGLGVATMPGLALAVHRADGVLATPVPGAFRHVVASTYGQAPDPPLTGALLRALRDATTSLRGRGTATAT